MGKLTGSDPNSHSAGLLVVFPDVTDESVDQTEIKCSSSYTQRQNETGRKDNDRLKTKTGQLVLVVDRELLDIALTLVIPHNPAHLRLKTNNVTYYQVKACDQVEMGSEHYIFLKQH